MTKKDLTAAVVLFVLATVSWSGLGQNAGLVSARAIADDHVAPGAKTSPPPAALDPRLENLRDRLRWVLDYHAKRPLNTSQHNAWEVMHMVIAQGVKSQVLVGGPRGEPQTAIGWLCFNHTFQGNRILTIDNGRPIGVIGVGLQGHPGQLLAILAQAHLRRDYPMHVAGRSFTVEDLIENERLTCRSGTELTFKLIAAAHYLSTDATWKNDSGQTWSISRLVREEIRAPIQGAACGGTHRLMGLAYAVRKRRKEGKPLDGEFRRANQYLQDYHRYAFQLQNPDGSFSTQWLESREGRPDLERRLQTSGHILEWLVFSLSDEELRQADTVRAVEYLTDLLADRPERRWSIGPLAHGLHALALYDQRVFRPLDAKPQDEASEDTPPAREPRVELLPTPAGEDPALARRLRLHHLQRSVAPAQETGPVLAPPTGVLK